MLILVVIGILSCDEDCSNADKLIYLNIEEITIKNFPNFKPNGDGWDDSFFESEYPADLVITVTNGGQYIGGTQIYMPNVESPSEVDFETSIPVTGVDLDLTISVWDMDEDENEFIGSVTGVPREIYRNSECSPTFNFDQGAMEIEIFATYTEIE